MIHIPVKNPLFETEFGQIAILSDREVDPDFEGELESHFMEFGFQQSSIDMLNMERLAKFNRDVNKKAGQQFDSIWEQVKKPVDRETLMRYSQQNPQLTKDLRDGMDIEQALRENARRVMERPGAMNQYALHYELVEQSTDQHEGSHLVALLQDHELVLPLSYGYDKKLAYHLVGRGGVMFGASNGLNGRSKKGHRYVIIPMSLVKDQTIDVQLNFAREIFNHEFVGHGMLGLEDHHDMDPKECVMATKKNKEEYLERSENYNGLYFCPSCRPL